MKTACLIAFLLSFTVCRAASPPPDYQHKTNEELLVLLNSSSVHTRFNALSGLQSNLFPLAVTRQASPGAALVANVTTKTFDLLKNEDDVNIKLVATNLLLTLNSWTDTVPMIEYGLTAKDHEVQINAIRALQFIAWDHDRKISTQAMQVLEVLLKPGSGDMDNIQILYQAAEAAGYMGREAETREQAKALIPLLQDLVKYPTKMTADPEGHTLSEVAAESIQEINAVKKQATAAP